MSRLQSLRERRIRFNQKSCKNCQTRVEMLKNSFLFFFFWLNLPRRLKSSLYNDLLKLAVRFFFLRIMYVVYIMSWYEIITFDKIVKEKLHACRNDGGSNHEIFNIFTYNFRERCVLSLRLAMRCKKETNSWLPK